MNPYYAVIFTSVHGDDLEGYSEAARRMDNLARKQPGFLGFETAREGKQGISVSYWSSLESIKEWKNNIDHLATQKQGKAKWYSEYKIRIAKVEREYEFS